MRNSMPYVIAEMGVNFFDTARELGIAPLEAAKKYVKAAADAGVDCAKFQSYKANTIASKNSPAYWDLNSEPTTSQYELFCKFDSFGEKEFVELAAYTHSLGMDFTSTPFDYASADYLCEHVDFYKISSSDVSNTPFVAHIAKKGKPVVISLGASYLSEADEVVRVLQSNGCSDITLLHCVLSYPTAPENANLNVIKTLKRVFPELKVGYSDHVAPDGCMQTLSAAYMLGAEVIEKHFTLDKTLKGNDHYHAGDPADFRKAIDNFKLINTVLGSSKKTVFECEEESRKQARRSLVFTHNMQAGDVICAEDVTAKRPGTGVSPSMMNAVVGRTLTKDVAEDDILNWDAL